MRHLKTLASALAIVMVTLMATDYVAIAATGKPIIMGKINKAKKTTTVKSAKGPALNLKTKAGQPPLKVNQKTLVKKFNADQVDGKSASDLGVRTIIDNFTESGTGVQYASHEVTGIPAGTYLVNYAWWIEKPTASPAYCYMYNSEGEYTGYSSSPDHAATNAIPVSGAGYTSIDAAGSLTLTCNLGVSSDFSTFDTAHVTLTPIDTSTGDAPERKAAPRKKSGDPADN
jgi:hypothetical protein